MNDLPPSDSDANLKPESTSPPPAKLFLGVSTLTPTTPVYRPYHRAPEPKPPFWTKDWFKFLVFMLLAGSACAGVYYQFFWLTRVPQEHDLTDLQGKSMHVNIIAHDDILLKYNIPGSETMHYLSMANLSHADQVFVSKLSQEPVAKLPFYCTLTDSAGKETPVRLIARNDDWAQYALISDGSTHYVRLASLTSSDQAVIRLLPTGLNFKFPMNFVFTGGPEAGDNVQLLGRNDDTVEYLDLAEGQKYFRGISDLSSIDQTFIREFPSYMVDRPPWASTDNPNPPAGSRVAVKAEKNIDPNAPLSTSMLNALVIVKGDYSEGSGFIAKFGDRYFVVTNQHVLSGNKEFTITTMDGNEIPTEGPLYGAVDYDVAILRIPDSVATHYLDVMPDPQINAKTGDHVTVCGNSLGAEVPSQINGDLMAIGPQLVEVSAPLQHGISGSPIIDRNAGKVIGIATMSITYQFDTANSGITTETRWFGYRVDNINPDKGWVKMDWVRFRDEGLKVRDAVDLYESLDEVLQNRSADDLSNDLVQAAVDQFQNDLTQAEERKSRLDEAAAYRTFASKLRSLADNGTTALPESTLYPYHAKIIKNLNDLSKLMDKAIDNSNRKLNNIVNTGP